MFQAVGRLTRRHSGEGVSRSAFFLWRVGSGEGRGNQRLPFHARSSPLEMTFKACFPAVFGFRPSSLNPHRLGVLPRPGGQAYLKRQRARGGGVTVAVCAPWSCLRGRQASPLLRQGAHGGRAGERWGKARVSVAVPGRGPLGGHGSAAAVCPVSPFPDSPSGMLRCAAECRGGCEETREREPGGCCVQAHRAGQAGTLPCCTFTSTCLETRAGATTARAGPGTRQIPAAGPRATPCPLPPRPGCRPGHRWDLLTAPSLALVDCLQVLSCATGRMIKKPLT